MSGESISGGSRMARGLLAGIVAGAVASFAMDRFQAIAASLSSRQGSDDEPATQKAADAIARAATGRAVPDGSKPLAGQGVHYAFGIALGAAYGVTAEFRRGVTAGGGSVFGLAVATIFDEAAVPAVGLGDAPWRASLGTTFYGYASHLVFGGITELVRRQVAGTLATSTD